MVVIQNDVIQACAMMDGIVTRNVQLGSLGAK